MLNEKKNKLFLRIFIGLVFLVMATAQYLIFLWVPEEKTLGVVQKIFYFHVGAAWVAFFAFFIVFVFSILYLATQERRWDRVSAASAEIGTVFTTIVLVTGPIWAKSSWNTWWTWEPRLTTSLILWFIYLAYILIRISAGDIERKAKLAAVFGIIGFLDVPVVFYAVNWWSVSHPMLFGQGKMNLASDMLLTLQVTVAAFTLLYFYLLEKGIAVFRMQDEVNKIKDRLREITD
ncbi:MAG: cytochrome c biogenesis protein [Desulfitobacteriaceae bacterium]|nr:cytochrome c biogenesis protein [Desulfitobacteriaceae bacterium]